VSEETPQDATPETPAVPETPAAPPTPPTEPPAAAVPTEETPAGTAPEPAPPAAPPTAPVVEAPVAAAPVAAAPVAPAPAERKVVAVPMSVLVTLGAIIVAVLMFGIGYAVGDSNNNDQAVTTQPRFQVPGLGGQGNTDNPNTPQIPVAPQNPNNGNGNNGNGSSNGNGNTQTAGSAFLGVATEQTNGGLKITQIVDNSAASKAGLKVDDVITEFDGDAVTTSAQLGAAVAQQDAGDQVKITYTRDGSTKTVTVTLGTRSTSN
jgi:membrane-associated protease RseP (regulator of RpoE activity)